MEVRYTVDYDIFKLVVGNRIIEPKQVTKLKKSFELVGPQVAIIVNTDMEVLDGQHRLKAAQELGIAIPYIIKDVSRANKTDIILAMNSTAKSWITDDYVHAHSVANIRGYADMEMLMRIYSYSYPTIADLMGLGKSIPKQKKELIFDLEDATNRVELHIALCAIVQATFGKVAGKQNLAAAIQVIYKQQKTNPVLEKNFSFVKVLKSISKVRGDKLAAPSSMTEYFVLLGEANDYGKKPADRIDNLLFGCLPK